MGSSGSKTASSSSSSANGGGGTRKGRLRGSKVFKSSCLGTSSSGSRDTDSDEPVCEIRSKENEIDTNQTDVESDDDHLKDDCYRKLKDEQSNRWSEATTTTTTTATAPASTTATTSSTHSLNPSSRFLSRFTLIPGNVSFRLSRATSLGSSRPYPAPSSSSSSSLSMLNDEEDSSQHNSDSGHVARIHHDNLGQGRETVSSTRNVASNAATLGTGNRVGLEFNLQPPTILNDSESIETRLSDRRTGVREPVEQNVRFSRTLSVGRLRDRVLRRSSLPDLIAASPMLQEREIRDANLPTRDTAVSPPVTANNSSSVSSSLISFQDAVETSRSRDTRYHDLLEHRSNFLERRRRIRSQVHALQRLGGRFENFSGHERSCILSGQHRTGRCTCRATNRNANLNDETTASASISRIVILAEALFEVLDEIHQQSVVLSSRPSVSSIGSIPAPNDAVESLPLKTYTKSLKHQTEDAAQCYICLVEYEEGDSMRILPCHHEFHRTCIDKWLKEIHRYELDLVLLPGQ
ncbi:hypothetical protein ACFE04_018738 [Oxalis oulophora]